MGFTHPYLNTKGEQMKVTVIPNIVEWHFLPELPNRDARVWYVREWETFPTELSEINYTVEGGWNTSRDQDGNLMNKSAFDPEATAWTYDAPYTVEVER